MNETDDSSWWINDPVPKSAERIFRMAWHLENWLRTMVYVEVRADRVNWKDAIPKEAGHQSTRYINSNKKLHHMATPYVSEFSYLSFGKTWDIISSSSNWPLFEPYFPPLDNAKTRVSEAIHIRDRISHFREPHPQDEARFTLFMNEMEAGVRKFCERYSVEWRPNPANDPVGDELKARWPHIGYGIELYGPNGWLYAPPPHTQQPKMNATLELLCHPSRKPGCNRGDIYKLTFSHRDKFDTVGFVECTEGLHKDIIHILLMGPHTPPSVMIPVTQGVEATAELIGNFLRAALDHQSANLPRELNREKLQWPEYVLWPGHMLTVFDERRVEPILNVE
jgi:hypothetical protein